MIGLDYFLDEKWFEKNSESLKNDRYFSTLPATVRKAFSWSFRQNVFDDKYLYDYINAYKVRRGSDTVDIFRYLEIVSILMLDQEFENKDITDLLKKLEKLDKGSKPADREERLLTNVLEIFDLVFQKKFPLNEENFELIVHILFRNLGYDLDIKESYKRKATSWSPFKGLLDISLIDNELQNLWSYLAKPKNSDFSGFTQAIMLGVEMLYISPFDSLNLVLAQFMVKWYLFQLDESFIAMNFSYIVGIKYQELVNAINDAFLRNFNLDTVEKLIKEYTLEQTNMGWKYLWLEKITADNADYKKCLSDVDQKLFMSRLLSIKKPEFNRNDIRNSLFENGRLTSEKKMDDFIKKFIDTGILEETKKDSYVFKNKEFEKMRIILVN